MSTPNGIPWNLASLRARSADNLRVARNVVSKQEAWGIASGCSRLYYAVMQGVLAKIGNDHGRSGLQQIGLGELRGKSHFNHKTLAKNLDMAGLNASEKIDYTDIFDLRILADYTTEDISFDDLKGTLNVGIALLARRLGVTLT